MSSFKIFPSLMLKTDFFYKIFQLKTVLLQTSVSKLIIDSWSAWSLYNKYIKSNLNFAAVLSVVPCCATLCHRNKIKIILRTQTHPACPGKASQCVPRMLPAFPWHGVLVWWQLQRGLKWIIWLLMVDILNESSSCICLYYSYSYSYSSIAKYAQETREKEL